MANRKPIVGGNWKMNLHQDQAIALARDVAQGAANTNAEVFVCPPLCYLQQVGQALREKQSPVVLAAQDFYFKPNGAYTGEVSLSMLKDVGVSTVLVGHSERRHVLHEPDTLINDKVLAALEQGMQAVLCIGETIEQREAGKTDSINAAQLAYGLAGVTNQQMAHVVIAYEPVWAIGTGKTATADDAQKAHQAIRQTVAFMFDQKVADNMRIQYGGSAKPDNAAELFSQDDIDGGLIGGASLKAQDFLAIVNATA